MISHPLPPLTWIDVAREIAGLEADALKMPPDLKRLKIGSYGIIIEVKRGYSQAEMLNWLDNIFPSRVDSEALCFKLDGPEIADSLPIEFEIQDTEKGFRSNFGVVDGVIDFDQIIPNELRKRRAPIVATLSVKGGTGRTTSAVAIALKWASSSQKPILLVDADLEAPGISYLFREIAGESRISLEDIIALAQGDDTPDYESTVSFAADRLRDHQVNGNLLILPLRRNIDELASSSVRAEHLSTPKMPFALADIISDVADRAGCEGVVIDVRAGLVPIGVNLALDPNVSPVIVTSLSDQALKATASFVKFVSREIRRSQGQPRRPLIIVNRVPSIFTQTKMDDQLLEPLITSLVSSLVVDDHSDVSAKEGIFDNSAGLEPFSLIKIQELPDLQVSSGAWDLFVNQIETSGFSRSISKDIQIWLRSELDYDASIESKALPVKQAPPISERRLKLAHFAEDLVAAENQTGSISKPLVTHPLAALASRFQAEVPIAISEGSKGTGKTLAARYFIDQKTWKNAVENLIHKKGAVDAIVIPVCASVQASSNMQSQVDRSRSEISSRMQLGEPAKVADTTAFLRSKLSAGLTEQEWAQIWLDVCAWSTGYKSNVIGAGAEFIIWLRDNNLQAIGLYEGLEELYVSVKEEGVPTMMRSLLVNVPLKLRSEVKKPLGILAFARKDTVETAIRQNLDQFRREFSSFALSWTEDDVLELAAWLATQADALPGLWDSEFTKLPQADKAAKLEQLWGRKLGPDDLPGQRIREAYTSTWIIAVLSDLQGRLVPRDLIRLLANAAKVTLRSEEQVDYGARLLTPRALKSAVEPTSQAKVKETEEEISELKPIFQKFRQNSDKVAAPINNESLKELSILDHELDTLKRHGIVFGDSAPYEVPELFRRGLGLRHSGARQSVVNLYRKARKKLN